MRVQFGVIIYTRARVPELSGDDYVACKSGG